MTLKLYMDEQVQSAITEGLRRRGVDMLTAQEDGQGGRDDTEVLNRAGELDRVLFTRDEDFLDEAARRQQSGEYFIGIIYAHQLYVSIGRCVQDLELIAGASDPTDQANKVVYLPFR